MTPHEFMQIQTALDVAGKSYEPYAACYNVIIEAIRHSVLDKFKILDNITIEQYDEALQNINELLEMIGK